MAYLGEEENLIKQFVGKVVKCSQCHYEFNIKSKTNAVFFVQLKLKPQIDNIVRKYKQHFTKADEHESKRDDILYEDITSGEYYKSIKQKYPDLLSLTFKTDGVRIFKSKKKSSLWPLQMVVNEIPKTERFRRENIIVSGLWYGPDPDFNMFLKPFIDDLNQLNKDKFTVTFEDDSRVSFTVCAIIMSTDTPAKAKVLNCLLFNGFFGCPYCFHPGNNSSGGSMLYPHSQGIKKRTHDLVLADALDALKRRNSGEKVDDVNGIKGPTPLFMLQGFDVVKGVPVDYMHACLHGMVGKLSGLWFDSENHNEKFYIGRPSQIEKIDERLAMIRPPKSFTRKPRSIKDRAFYKASEELYFLLHYGAACLSNIFPTYTSSTSSCYPRLLSF